MSGRLDDLAHRLRRAAGPAQASSAPDDLLALAEELFEIARTAEDRERRLRETVHRQNHGLETKILELSILKRLGDLIADSLALEDLLERVLGVLVEEMRLERGSIMLLDPATGELAIETGIGSKAEPEPGQSPDLRLGEGIAGWVAASREALIVPDVSRDVRFKRVGGSTEATGSLLCVPLFAEKKVLGVLNLSTSEVGAFDSSHVRILRIAAGQIASALRGMDMHRELRAFSDHLEDTVEERTIELSRRTDDLRRKNDQITELYFSLEEAQQELEERNRDLVEVFTFHDNIVETVGVGIGVVAHDGKIVTWNRAMGEITEGLLCKEKVLGRRIQEIPPDQRDEFALGRPLSDALRRGEDVRLRDHRVELPSGRILHLNIHHLPVSIANDGNNQVLTVIENVTDNVERYEQQVKAERLSAITATMVSVNHEVNNPLAVILGYVQMLLRGLEAPKGPPEKGMRRRLELVEKEAMRIREITQKLATLAEPALVSYPSSEGTVRMVDVSRSR